jgi:hypothetical protein
LTGGATSQSVFPIEKPAEVGFGELRYRQATSLEAMGDGTWFYDAARKNLHVRTRVRAGQDRIVNVGW